MNENPWRVDDLARLQRERLQEEMRQIRLEEKALKAGLHEPGLLQKLLGRLRSWARASQPQPVHPVQARRPLKLAHSRHHSHI